MVMAPPMPQPGWGSPQDMLPGQDWGAPKGLGMPEDVLKRGKDMVEDWLERLKGGDKPPVGMDQDVGSGKENAPPRMRDDGPGVAMPSLGYLSSNPSYS